MKGRDIECQDENRSIKECIKGSGALLGGEGAQLLNRARYYGRKDILNHIKSVLHLF